MALTKIANDIRWLGSGPRCGLGELKLPEVQPGSSIMPGKVNPVIAESLLMVCAQVIGYDAAIAWCCAAGNFELNVMMPVMAYDLLESIELLAAGSRNFAAKCIAGLEANEDRLHELMEQSLALCTALTPEIGYDRAAELAKKASATEEDHSRGRSGRERHSGRAAGALTRPIKHDRWQVMVPTMTNDQLDTHQKAIRINQDGSRFGAFAEIGAGQEVVRWFFHAGGASKTVAKSISAYDMAASDDLYGPTKRYVSRERLESMLDCEYKQIVERSSAKRGDTTAFFVFADTVATRVPASHRPEGQGWLGVRFQHEPKAEPSEVIVHARLFDVTSTAEQEAIGILGVNLCYGALYHHGEPQLLISTLLDNLSRRRVEVDMIKFSGPAYSGIDNRLMSLQLVEQGLTDATMFTAQGEVVQPAEVLYQKPVLIERGSFRPVTNVTLENPGSCACPASRRSPNCGSGAGRSLRDDSE